MQRDHSTIPVWARSAPAGLREEIDLELMAFIQCYAATWIKSDIIALFGREPFLRICADEIARRLGLKPHVIKHEIGALTLLGLLERIQTQRGFVFQLTREQRTRELVERFAGRAVHFSLRAS